MNENKEKSRTLRIYYECINKYGKPDKEYIDIDVTHCVNISGKFDPTKVWEDITLITQEDVEEYDRIGIM